MPNQLPNTLDVNIVRLFKALYDSAPGYTYLSAYRQLGMQAGAVGRDPAIAVSTALNQMFANFSAEQWAELIVDNLHISGQARTVARDFLVISQALYGGPTQASLVEWRSTNLAGLLLGYASSFESDGLFGQHAVYFNRSIQASYQYSVSPVNGGPFVDLRLVDEPNDAPVALDDTAFATEGGERIAGSVADNDSDPEGDPLFYWLAPEKPVPGFVLAGDGRYTFDPADPAYDFIPAGVVHTVDIAIKVSDGIDASMSRLTIDVAGSNDAPGRHLMFVSGSAGGVLTIPPVVTDADHGDSSTVQVVAPPQHGGVAPDVNGHFVYIAQAGYVGSDTFTYRVTDAAGASSTSVVTLLLAATGIAGHEATGSAGHDAIWASRGDDRIDGSGGDDTIDAGAGADTLIGGDGADRLSGGSGADRFAYPRLAHSSGLLRAIDTITDFASGSDVIDFRAASLDPFVRAGHDIAGQPIHFGGNGLNFGDAQAGLRRGDGVVDVVFQQDEAILWVDLDDDGTLGPLDLRIRLAGVSSLTAADVLDGSTMS